MTKKASLGFADINNVLFWTFLYRLVSVAVVMVTMPMRPTLPRWMVEAFQACSYPLFLYSLALILLRKKLILVLRSHPYLLFIDLLISLGILQLGGSWRSSYFAYTVTTIMICTTFEGKRGAYVSAGGLTLAGIIKDPSGGLASLDIFYISDWDMRVGAAFFYLGTGLIFGYFYTLLLRLETLSREKIEETRKLAIVEEKNRMTLELHDGAKQMINAVLLKMNPVIKNFRYSRDKTAEDIRWLWKAMHYLKTEMNQVMDALGEGEDSPSKEYLLLPIVEEEARIVEAMTGFSWNITAEPHDSAIPLRSHTALRRLLSEAFMNAWKHSGATSGAVTMKSLGTTAIITIADKGKGFEYVADEKRLTTGLKSLKHRATELNGDLVIESAPDKGCTLILTLESN